MARKNNVIGVVEEERVEPGRTWWHDVCEVHGWTAFATEAGGCVECSTLRGKQRPTTSLTTDVQSAMTTGAR